MKRSDVDTGHHEGGQRSGSVQENNIGHCAVLVIYLKSISMPGLREWTWKVDLLVSNQIIISRI